MESPKGSDTDIHSEAFLHSLMRKQLKRSIALEDREVSEVEREKRGGVDRDK